MKSDDAVVFINRAMASCDIEYKDASLETARKRIIELEVKVAGLQKELAKLHRNPGHIVDL